MVFKSRVPALAVAVLIMLSMIATVVVPTDTASAETYGDLEYRFVDSYNNIEITGYTGSDEAVVIPAEINGYNVLGIGKNAFQDNNVITSVSIPQTVTYIDEFAFSGCTALTSVTMPGVRTLCDMAFSGCTALASLTLPACLSTIREQVFNGLSSLAVFTVDANNNNFVVQDGVLYNKAMTTLISHPAGKAGAFVIPSTVTTVKSGAFMDNRLLTSLSIPASVSTISDHNWAFMGCTALASIDVSENNADYASRDGVLYNKDNKTLICYPAGRAAPSFTIPGTVTEIGSYSFYMASGLTTVTIPDSVISIGDIAFGYCINLATMIFEGSAPNTGSYWAGGSNLIAYYHYGSTGFITPTWRGVPTVVLGDAPIMPSLTLAADGDTAILTWSEPAYTGTSPIDYYLLSYRDGTGQIRVTERISASGPLTYTATGLAYNREYLFNVTAHNGAGDGLASQTVKFIPMGLTITDPQEGNLNTTGSVIIKWSIETYASYIGKAEVSLDGANWVRASGTSRLLESLSDGTHTVVVKVTSTAGNSQTASRTFVVDQKRPWASITSPAGDSIVKGPDVTLTWTNNTHATTVELCVQGTWIDVTGESSHEFSFPDGEHTVTIRARNNEGVNYESPVTFTVDSTAPALAINSPSGGATLTSASVEIRWTAGADANSVEISTNNMDWIAVTGQSSKTMSFSDGVHTVYLRAADNLGNQRTVHVTFTVDTVAPALEITAPTGTWSDSSSVEVTWIGGPDTAAVKVRIDNEAWMDPSRTAGHTFTALSDGTHTAYVRVTDAAGNSRIASVSFTVDTVKPTVEISSPVSGAFIGSSSVTIAWTAGDLNGIGMIEIRTEGTDWTAASGTSHVLPLLADGQHTIYLRVTDSAGNQETAQATFTVDTVAPTVTSKSPEGTGIMVGSSISISFSEAMNQTSVVMIINGVEVELVWDGDMATFAPSSPLAYNALHTVVISGKDLVGNAIGTTAWSFMTMGDEGAVSGVVKDADGNPISGATVRLNSTVSTTTNATGYFVFNDVVPGTYALNVSKEGYRPMEQSVTIADGEDESIGTLSLQAAAGGNTGKEDAPDNTVLYAAIVAFVAVAAIVAFVFLRKKE